jgi:DNA (cytosine-5)-methyltransferase 1
VAKELGNSKFSVADLFCGAGGLSLGFERAGWNVTYAADLSEAAVATYSRNFPMRAERVDLSSEEYEAPKATVFVGGPPCQGFSSAGMRRSGDKRNNLVGSFARLVAVQRPEAFVFENVEGFLTAHDGEFVVDLLGPLLTAGYRIHIRKINAANFGVPQHRKRVIAVGGLGWEPSFPKPTHTAFGAPGALLASEYLPLSPTVENAIAGLPAAAEEAPGQPQGHYCKALTGEDADRARALQPGQTMRDLPEAMHHRSYRRRAFRRVMDGTPTERRGGAPAGIRRLRANEPSKAITAGAKSEFLHPVEHRPLTLRECARLQTFPDDFIFLGRESEQWELLGNAVPPLLAYRIALDLFSDIEEAPTRGSRGALLSFVPTLSQGCSPALKAVSALVQKKFSTFVQPKELSLWR